MGIHSVDSTRAASRGFSGYQRSDRTYKVQVVPSHGVRNADSIGGRARSWNKPQLDLSTVLLLLGLCLVVTACFACPALLNLLPGLHLLLSVWQGAGVLLMSLLALATLSASLLARSRRDCLEELASQGEARTFWTPKALVGSTTVKETWGSATLAR